MKFRHLGYRRAWVKGFTLIELMVVISIIGILAALGTVSYMTAQQKARDAKRKADIKAVSNAFEQHYQNNTAYDATSATCANILADGVVLPGGAPRDPKNVDPYVYSYGCSADTFCVCAVMEGGGGNSGASCANFGTATTHFCVMNQQ